MLQNILCTLEYSLCHSVMSIQVPFLDYIGTSVLLLQTGELLPSTEIDNITLALIYDDIMYKKNGTVSKFLPKSPSVVFATAF